VQDTFFQITTKRETNGCVEGSAKRPNGFRVCLVTALTIADFIDLTATVSARQDVGAQLGIFTLAAILREHGFATHVVNLDDWFLDFLRLKEGAAFLDFVIERLALSSFDLFGLSSICSSYPLTLRLARELKRLRPNTPIVLGGPQASVVDLATMSAFSCVDAVVRGEADESLPVVLDHLRRKSPLDGIPGVTFRRAGEIIQNPNGPVVQDLDRLPLPAFDLDSNLKNRGGIHIEIGRGCPFACTFCSTNDFFRRNFRLKSTRKTIEEMKHIKGEYGISYFSMVHDMYTVNRKRVVEFCEALVESGEDFTWGCSARTDCIDNELIGLMARAGCRGIFFGIETGSMRLQQQIHKKLDLSEAWERIKCADEHGITTAVALITGFPDETRDDLRDTVHFFIESLRYDHAEPQLSLLAPLAATPIHDRYRAKLIFDDIFSDMSHQGWRQDREDVELIKSYPEIFPNFYAVPTECLDRGYFKEIHDFVTYLTSWFRWLAVGILQDSGDLLEVFDRWREWLADRRAAGNAADTGIAPYYTHRQFRDEFLEFVRTSYCEEKAIARAAMLALIDSEGWCSADRKSYAPEAVEEVNELSPDAYPYATERTVVLDLAVDYKELIAALRLGGDLRQTRVRNVTLVFRPIETDEVQVWQLTPLSAVLFRQCNGTKSVNEIIQEFSERETDIDGIPSRKVATFGLLLLRSQGFIGLSQRPVCGQVLQNGESPRFVPPPQVSANQQPWPRFSAPATS